MTDTTHTFAGRVPRGVVPVVPGPGQESVWDYPRPPVVQPVTQRIHVRLGGETVADTTRALRVLETGHAPCYYIPREDVLADHVTAAPGHTVCEFKGTASYWTIRGGDRTSAGAAWSYEDPTPEFRALAGHLAFYAGKVDECFVGEEHARPQPGGYYGGWVTSAITGPVKGEEGSGGW